MQWTIIISFLKRPSRRSFLKFIRELSALYAGRYFVFGEYGRPNFCLLITPQEDFVSAPAAIVSNVNTMAVAEFGAVNIRSIVALPSQGFPIFHFNGAATSGGVTEVLPRRSRNLLVDNLDASNGLEVSFDLGQNVQLIPAGGSLSIDAQVDSLFLRGVSGTVAYSGLET